MSFLKKYSPHFSLIALWFLTILIVNPSGNFPLNDDWSYAKSVETLFYDGYLKLYNWGEMTLVAHVYWGFLFTKLFGFSFTVLRWSTLVMGTGSIVGIYAICRLVHPSKFMALSVALLCLFNPIFMSLSFSFMTDVPFFCLSLWAFYGFIKYHQSGQFKFLLLAILFCYWSFLIRQLALVFPLAWLISFLFTKPLSKKNLFYAILPLVSMLLLYVSYTSIMSSSGLLQERYNDKLGLLGRTLLEAEPKLLVNIPGYFFVVLMYLGFFLAPFHWYYLQAKKAQLKYKWLVAYIIIIGSSLVLGGKSIPSLDNVLVDFGVGPITLFDHYGKFTNSPSPSAFPLLLWLITLLGVSFSFAWVIKGLNGFVLARKKERFSFTQVFAFISIIIYLSPFLIVGIYDRYLLFLIPLVLVLLLHKIEFVPSNNYKKISILFVAVLAYFSTCATHDYLSWNRVRWEVLSELNESGVPLNEIQGGVEFTAWHHYSDNNDKWWEQVDNNYILVFNTNSEDIIIDSYSYNRWLPGKGALFLIKKKP